MNGESGRSIRCQTHWTHSDASPLSFFLLTPVALIWFRRVWLWVKQVWNPPGAQLADD